MYIPGEALQHIQQNPELPRYNRALEISHKPFEKRSNKEQDILLNIFESIPDIDKSFGNLIFSRDLLSRCSQKFEHRQYNLGSLLIERGQKCDELIIVLKGAVNAYDLKPYNQITKQKTQYTELGDNKSPNNNSPSHNSGGQQSRKPKKRRSFLADSKDCSPIRRVPTIQLSQRVRTLSSEGSNDGQSRSRLTPVQSPMNFKPPKSSGPASPASPIHMVHINDQSPIHSLFPPQFLENPNPNLNPNPKPAMLSKPRLNDKISGVLSLITLKAPEVTSEEIERREQNRYRHLPKQEMLVLKNDEMKKKYMHNGACLLAWKDTVGPGAIINQHCFKGDSRGEYTYIAAENTEVVILSKKAFAALFEAELSSLAEKKKYFAEFFKKAHQISMSIFLTYITEKSYMINDKVYDQSDEANGLFFIRFGEVKCCTNLVQEPEEPEEVMITRSRSERIRTEPSDHSNSPLRKEVVGTQWLRGGRRTKKSNAPVGKCFAPLNQVNQVYKATVGTLGAGNTFGEEGLVTSEKKRAYATFAATNNLQLYFLSAQYYSTIELIYPGLAQILIEKAKSKNLWLENRVEDIKEVKGVLDEYYQGGMKYIRETSPKRSKSPGVLFKKPFCRDFTSIGRKNFTKPKDVDIEFNADALVHDNTEKSPAKSKQETELPVVSRLMARAKSKVSLTPERRRRLKEQLQEKVEGPTTNFLPRNRSVHLVNTGEKPAEGNNNEPVKGILKKQNSVCMEVLYREIRKFAHNGYGEFALPVPELDNTYGEPHFERVPSFTDNDRSFSSVLPTKVFESPLRESSAKQDRQDTYPSTGSTNNTKPSIKRVRIIGGQNYSIPVAGSISGRVENRYVQEDYSFSGILNTTNTQGPDNGDQSSINHYLGIMGSMTERKGVTRSPEGGKYEQAKKVREESEEKKRAIIRSKHNMFRVKPKNPQIVGEKYQIRPSSEVERR